MLLKVSGKCSSFEVKAADRNQKADISFAEFGKVLKPPSYSAQFRADHQVILGE